MSPIRPRVGRHRRVLRVLAVLGVAASVVVPALVVATTPALAATSAYADAVAADGAVGYWPLGGTSGTAANEATGAGALPALNYAGTVASGASPTAALGGSSSAFSSGGNAWATMSSDITDGYTVAGWVKVAADPTYNDGEPVVYGNFFYWGSTGFGINSSGNFTTIYDGESWQQTSTAMPLQTWEFLTVTLSTSGVATYYLDDTPVTTTSSPVAAGDEIILDDSSGGRWVDASMADVAYFPSVLSTSQIDQLYTLGENGGAPVITSASTAVFSSLQSHSFTVTTTGYPTPSLTESGALPAGLSFADNGNGTATISGRTSAANGSYPVTITATNSFGTATQTLTLQVVTGFFYTGSATTWTVPAGVYSITVDMTGAAGGDAATPGGLGGRVQGTIAVTPGEVLTVGVAGAGGAAVGETGGAGGFGGGGAGGAGYSGCASAAFGGGGGASYVEAGTTMLAVAGGGGGGGGLNPACSPYGAGGAGGTPSSAGATSLEGGSVAYWGGGGGGGWPGGAAGSYGPSYGGYSLVPSGGTATVGYESGNGYVYLSHSSGSSGGVAAGSAVGNATATLTSGVLSFVAAPGNLAFPAVDLDGVDQMTSASLGIGISDGTGSGAGWALDATSTTFSNGTSELPADSVTVDTAPSVACDTGADCTPATDGVSYPYVLPAGTSAPPATALFSAAVGTGMGDQTVTPVFSLAVPANAAAGAYSATWTFSLVSGP